jgi:hypothetical protein
VYGGGDREPFWSDWLRDVIEFDVRRRKECLEEEVYDRENYDTEDNSSSPRPNKWRLIVGIRSFL